MMFSLAVTTTAAYAAVHAGFFARRESPAYRAWLAGFAPRLYAAGLVGFAATGSWYVFGTWSGEVRGLMFRGPYLGLTALTAASPALVLALLLFGRAASSTRRALAVALAQVGVLALNAASRQVVQNAELRPLLDVAAERVQPQWSPLVLFLMLFVAGLGVVAWMMYKVVAAERRVASLDG